MDAPTVAVAGATGSIGTQTLDVIEAEPERFDLVALGASGRDVDALIRVAQRGRPGIVAAADPSAESALLSALPGVEVRVGPGALESLAEEADVVVNGVVGFAGLAVTLAALRGGCRLALANKESLIAGGPVVQAARRTPGAELLPVDSEHAALHQCLRANDNSSRVSRLVLTASGGPFRGRSRADLESVTVDEALAHPTWAMGPKITVDSSTLMNKGLEVIEAHELFGPPAGDAGFGVGLDQIDVVVHPQSVVHSMAEYSDGSTIAQLSMPDMRLPIGYALTYPDRLGTPFGSMDWSRTARLDFEPPDHEAFPCLGLAFDAARMGGSAPAWMNAANEEAVAAFLSGRISWVRIADVVEEALSVHDGTKAESADVVIDTDRRARATTREIMKRYAR